MAKSGLDGASIGSLLAEASSANGWALCIGAGTSRPSFPSWADLVESLVREDVAGPSGSAVANELLATFSPDSLIQAACDRLGLDEERFVGKLTDLLYAGLRSRLCASDWQLVAKAFDATSPGALDLEAWRRFHSIRAREFSDTSASVLAEHVARTIGTSRAPSAILSFNAEPLLYALINDSVVHSTVSADQKNPGKGQLTQPLDHVTRIISDRKPGRLPYIFCHGRLPVPDAPGRPFPLQSTDKLVYAESQYLHLASTSYAWQSSSFLDICGSRRVLFVGVSLADPNMRRWLSWVHTIRMQELAEQKGYSGPSTRHIWVQVTPESEALAQWVEAAVGHLGVRVVWLEKWSNLDYVMSQMLAA